MLFILIKLFGGHPVMISICKAPGSVEGAGRLVKSEGAGLKAVDASVVDIRGVDL